MKHIAWLLALTIVPMAAADHMQAENHQTHATMTVDETWFTYDAPNGTWTLGHGLVQYTTTIEALVTFDDTNGDGHYQADEETGRWNLTDLAWYDIEDEATPDGHKFTGRAALDAPAGTPFVLADALGRTVTITIEGNHSGLFTAVADTEGFDENTSTAFLAADQIPDVVGTFVHAANTTVVNHTQADAGYAFAPGTTHEYAYEAPKTTLSGDDDKILDIGWPAIILGAALVIAVVAIVVVSRK